MLARPVLARVSVSSLMLTLLAGVSRAEEAKEGMPQLDPHSFASQLFWLAIFFLAVFLFLRFIGLPRVTAIIDERANKIGGDIASAELLRAQAAVAEQTYETTMAAAHSKARQLLVETYEQNAAALAEQTKEATASADRQVHQAVKRIEADRAEALAGIREVARGLAADITAKLAGHMPSADRVTHAVDRAAGEIA